jgi:hypothetical protein
MNALGPVTVGGNRQMAARTWLREFQELVLVFLVNVPRPFP